jgi:hypothetical protein
MEVAASTAVVAVFTEAVAVGSTVAEATAGSAVALDSTVAADSAAAQSAIGPPSAVDSMVAASLPDAVASLPFGRDSSPDVAFSPAL